MPSHHLRWLLGIDAGSDSIGWAAFGFDPSSGASDRLLDGGVRLFDWGRDPQSKESYMADRGRKRRSRRRLRGKVWRRTRLIELLSEAGIQVPEPLPNDIWSVRARAAQEPVAAPELAALLLYLCRHRGFKSPKLAVQERGEGEFGSNKPPDWDVVERDLRAEMAPGDTVGTLLARRLAQQGYVRARRGIGRVATRPLVAEEFARIRAVQAPHHPLSEEQWERAGELILDQRPFRSPAPGRCTFFPDDVRLAKAMPSAQRYLVRSTLANLRIREEALAPPRPLSEAEHEVLAALLDRGGTHNWSALRRAIRLGRRAKFTIETERALGAGKRASRSTEGDQTAQLMLELWPDWADRPLADQDELVASLFAVRRDRRKLVARAVALGLNAERAEALGDAVQFGLPKEHLRIGGRAVAAILPHLLPGVPLHEAIERGIGRPHSARPRDGGLLSSLPYYGEALPHRVLPYAGGSPEEERHGALGNVTVHIALNEIRKIVNKLVARYGNPARIVIETTRELKASKDRLRAIEREQQARERERARIEAEIADDVKRTLGRDGRAARAAASRTEQIRRWRLADRQQNLCPYTGNMIARADLFTAFYQIDHIVPLSRGGFDSFDNMVLCEADANREKADRTPWEAWSSDAERWRRIAEAAGRLPKEMQWRFAEDAAARVEAEDSGFLPRQIRDTSYIARVAMEYLELVAPEVGATRGRLTAYLRSAWGLPKGREDHRHHFVDAAVIAVTNRGIVKQVNTLHARGPLPPAREAGIEPPFPGFSEEVERRYGRLWPSARPDHSLAFPSGALHQERHYAVRLDSQGKYRRAARAALDELFRPKGSYVDDKAAEKAIDRFVSARFRKRFLEAIAKEREADSDLGMAAAAVRAAGQCQFGKRGLGKVLCWDGAPVDDPEDLLRVPRGDATTHRPAVRPAGCAWVDVLAEGGKWKSKVVGRQEAAAEAAGAVLPPNLV